MYTITQYICIGYMIESIYRLPKNRYTSDGIRLRLDIFEQQQ